MNHQPSTINSQRPTDWKRVAGRVWAAQSRADLNERPRLLLAWIIRGTVECGRTQLLVPDFGELFAMLHITPNHRKEVCQVLKQANICDFARVHGARRTGDAGWLVTLFADPGQWRCGWYHAEDAKARWLDRLNALPGQCQGQLIEPEPGLVDALAAVAVEASGKVDGVLLMVDGGGGKGSTSQDGKWLGVPKMGSRAAPVNSKDNGFTKQLTVNCSRSRGTALDGKGGGEKGPGAGCQVSGGASLSREEEREAMGLLEVLVGEEDVRNWGGDWRKNWLRRYPREFVAALRTLLEESKTGWTAKTSPGAALKDLTRRYAGNVMRDP